MVFSINCSVLENPVNNSRCMVITLYELNFRSKIVYKHSAQNISNFPFVELENFTKDHKKWADLHFFIMTTFPRLAFVCPNLGGKTVRKQCNKFIRTGKFLQLSSPLDFERNLFYGIRSNCWITQQQLFISYSSGYWWQLILPDEVRYQLS